MKLEDIKPEELPSLVKLTNAKVSQAFLRIRKKKPKHLDTLVLSLHQAAFDNYDCLTCGNCCRTLGPRILESDIDKLAKHFRTKPAKIIADYLHIDEDNDYVFQHMPCPFLSDDNYCMVYENRPKACREYPHTDRRKFVQILNETFRNRETCPVVYQISEQLSDEF